MASEIQINAQKAFYSSNKEDKPKRLTFNLLKGKDKELIDKVFPKNSDLIEVNPGSIIIPKGYKYIGERILDLEVRPDDVWVVSYPRTGSTWTQELVWLLGNNLDYETAKQPQPFRTPLLEMSGVMSSEEDIMNWITSNGNSVDVVENCPSPRFIKTHLPWNLLPRQLGIVKPKIVYVTRNPKDMCVSYYNYCCLIHRVIEDSFEEFCDLFLRNKAPLGNIWDHILDFWERRHQPNILFIKYEDMKRDFMSQMKRVAKFLDKNPSEEELIQLEEYLSFQNMKKNPAVNLQPIMEALRGKDYMGSKHRPDFIRKGEVGDWKNFMNPELAEKFDKWTAEHLHGTDLRYD